MLNLFVPTGTVQSENVCIQRKHSHDCHEKMAEVLLGCLTGLRIAWFVVIFKFVQTYPRE